jgi:hypothetical protein
VQFTVETSQLVSIGFFHNTLDLVHPIRSRMAKGTQTSGKARRSTFHEHGGVGALRTVNHVFEDIATKTGNLVAKHGVSTKETRCFARLALLCGWRCQHSSVMGFKFGYDALSTEYLL